MQIVSTYEVVNTKKTKVKFTSVDVISITRLKNTNFIFKGQLIRTPISRRFFSNNNVRINSKTEDKKVLAPNSVEDLDTILEDTLPLRAQEPVHTNVQPINIEIEDAQPINIENVSAQSENFSTINHNIGTLDQASDNTHNGLSLASDQLLSKLSPDSRLDSNVIMDYIYKTIDIEYLSKLIQIISDNLVHLNSSDLIKLPFFSLLGHFLINHCDKLHVSKHVNFNKDEYNNISASHNNSIQVYMGEMPWDGEGKGKKRAGAEDTQTPLLSIISLYEHKDLVLKAIEELAQTESKKLPEEKIGESSQVTMSDTAISLSTLTQELQDITRDIIMHPDNYNI
jgi:hypothetical protein